MTIQSKKENIIFGRVVDQRNRPLVNLIVQAFDRDMRKEELLGESITDREGKYEITWLHSQLNGRDKKEADIVVKVLTREKKTLLYESDMDALRFNASVREEINITIESIIKPEVVEYDHILREIKFLADKVAITDLQENDQHRDVTFLSKEAEIESEKIEHLVVAHRLNAESKIEAAFFYALLRKNTLLKNDLAKSIQARLVIDINTEILPLLYEAALADPKVIQRDIKNAAKEMLISAAVAKGYKRNAEQLQQFRSKAKKYYENDHSRKLINLIGRFVLEDKISELTKLSQENKNDLNVFLKKISAESLFKNDEKSKEAKASLALGELLGFDEAIISQVKDIQKIKKPEDIKKLAALNKTEWKKLLAKSADKISLSGEPLDSSLLDLHASSLARKMEKKYPTVAFSAQLAREKKTIFNNQDSIKDFLTKHDEFDLQHSNIDLFLKKKKLNTQKNEGMREELKSVQRVFKLVPHYNKTNTLLKENIHSAQDIVGLGETRFIKEIAPKAGINAKEAKEIFGKAERTNTAAMLIVGELQGTIRAADIPALEMTSVSKKLEAVSDDFPNLKSLFSMTDTCICEHCRSVYSPAAYLVEILQFLDKRSVTDLTLDPPVTTNLAKDVLFERRPDLGEIDLGCENANTPVPYIDLVNELLEEAVSPAAGIPFTDDLSDGPNPLLGKISTDLLAALQTAGLPVTDQAQIFETETSNGSSAILPHYLRDKKVVCKIINSGGNNYEVFQLRQTLSTTEELAAAPEYVNQKAYEELKKSGFAFKLPFDLNHTEAKAYFSRFDISRAKLMEDFQSVGNPADESIAAEKLGLTDAERILVVSPKDTLADQQLHWNAPLQWDTEPVISGNVVDYMKRVDHFLDKTGLTYKDLELLLSLKFIDQNNNLFIQHLDLSSDTEKKEIANLNDAALDRIHRFLRLQKKTDWNFEILDEIISQSGLGNGQLDDACLINASTLLKLSEETGIKIAELLGFYKEIPHEALMENGPTPLYHQFFLNKAKNGFIDDDLLSEKIDGSQLLTSNNIISSISVCLQISEQDLDKLSSLLPDENLNFPNLSYLFAASRLMKKLKLKAENFTILVQLTGINIQDSPQATLDFVEEVKVSQISPLNAADIQFMLRHEATNLVEREIKIEKITQILESLQKEYQSNFSANKSPFDGNLSADEQKETLQIALSKLSGIEEEDVKTFIKFIDRDWDTAIAAKTFTENKLKDLFDTTAIKTRIDVLSTASNVDPDDISQEQQDLVKAFLDAIADYQLQNGKLSILDQILATTFKAESDLMKIVLKHAILKQPAPGTSLLADILLSDSLIDVDITHAIPVLPAINDVDFSNQYRAIKLLHKLSPLINAFELDYSEIAWFFENNTALGWLMWDDIPYEPGQTPIDYGKYTEFTKLVDLLKQLTPVSNPADVEHPITFFTLTEMFLPANGASRPQFLEAFSLLTGYSKEDVDAIDAHLFPVFIIDEYRNPKTWKSISDCAGHLRKLGSTVAQIKEYIKPILTNADTNLLRTALKARYDEDTWLSTLREIMDVIRSQKRDALVAYLLATNPELKDENHLYDYFLVDVEMEACMPSSRIVQAHGTIQLFVQRCLMGLEPKAAADINNDKSWEQWKWMRNYRVWEANRKVFLYPENWIEPELRDDKSFLFTELENELLQNELTEITAEEALIKYLEKLDDIAFLEVIATWYQSDIRTMHVFTRTKGGDPAIYYYRKFEQERYWTPWEKVELDITGDHLLAFVHNNRLSLAWPVFSEVPEVNAKIEIPDSTPGTKVQGTPKRRLKIQLAVSDFANNNWQPKKISKDAILTPSIPTEYDDDLRRDKYNLIYVEKDQQVWFCSTGGNAYNNTLLKKGVFNIAGCKGYPELLDLDPKEASPVFLPKFKDTELKSQRHHELGDDKLNDLAVKNGVSLTINSDFLEILGETPDIFRLTYPLQMTKLDDIVGIYQTIMLLVYGSLEAMNNNLYSYFERFTALGTLLPYFKEDSNHAYVIVPGFYKDKERDEEGNITLVNRTASNAMELVEDMNALVKKYIAKYAKKPNIDALLEELMEDNDYYKIVDELNVYGELQYGEQFKNMYHPLVCSLRTILYKDGILELMKRETQLDETDFDFNNHYNPNSLRVPKPYPIEDMDFSSDGSFSGYNWELFFHIPFLMATRLTQNQRFEEAMTWFHYMFNPTGALDGKTPQKYWVTKPFYLTHDDDYFNQRIDTLLYKIADPNTAERKELEFTIDQWRDKPFKPHVIARFRPVAYQKALLMKYIDNLTEWGDYLFRQDTMESITQATQMYIMADKLLGPKPRSVPPAIKAPYETYNQIEAKLSLFGNALIDLENILPDLSTLPEGGAELPPTPVTLSMLYFCIPQNEKMLEYWDRIEDRLLKIRHCQNIDGFERTLALFAPPIDPGMLVRAAAAGLDISSILAGINAPTPYYRFNVLSQKATELAQEVRGLGSSLLQALEKKDAEAMSLLRSKLELKLLNSIKDMKLLQIEEANEQIEILKRTKIVTEERYEYYSSIEKIISKEQLNLDELSDAQDWQFLAQSSAALAGLMSLLGDLIIGGSGFGGSPVATAKYGGFNFMQAARSAGDGFNILSSISSYKATRASIHGGYDRRFDDWKLQERLADKELKSIEKQIVAAEIRKEIAETDLNNHDLQIENAKKTDEFMKSKFTNKDLYDWMIGQISSVYFRAYQLAHDFAKKAERSYRFELGNDDTFISYGYWDSMKKGLQSADHLINDIKRMETSYLDKNIREYELTKHVSLVMLDPLALVKLRATGVCDFDIPEALFDLDHAGHYFRRIKSVSISLPCIAGPYTSVSAKLSLIKNKYRKNTNDPIGYPEDVGNDQRFVYNVGAIQSIAASNSQNDSGMFELNFRDERYLPFEGTGAISSWRLELPKKEMSMFDYDSISDVIVHVKYTARDGGSSLRQNAEDSLMDQLAIISQKLDQTGLHVAINLKHDLPNDWHILKKNGTIDIAIDKSRLPYMAQSMNATIENIVFIAKAKTNPEIFTIKIDDGNDINLKKEGEWKLCLGDKDSLDNTPNIALDTLFKLSVVQAAQLNDLEELMMVVKYKFN